MILVNSLSPRFFSRLRSYDSHPVSILLLLLISFFLSQQTICRLALLGLVICMQSVTPPWVVGSISIMLINIKQDTTDSHSLPLSLIWLDTGWLSPPSTLMLEIVVAMQSWTCLPPILQPPLLPVMPLTCPFLGQQPAAQPTLQGNDQSNLCLSGTKHSGILPPSHKSRNTLHPNQLWRARYFPVDDREASSV